MPNNLFGLQILCIDSILDRGYNYTTFAIMLLVNKSGSLDNQRPAHSTMEAPAFAFRASSGGWR